MSALEIEHRHNESETTIWDNTYPFTQHSTWAVTAFWLRLTDGRRVRAWQASGHGRRTAEAWVRQMAAVVGVPVEA